MILVDHTMTYCVYYATCLDPTNPSRGGLRSHASLDYPDVVKWMVEQAEDRCVSFVLKTTAVTTERVSDPRLLETP